MHIDHFLFIAAAFPPMDITGPHMKSRNALNNRQFSPLGGNALEIFGIAFIAALHGDGVIEKDFAVLGTQTTQVNFETSLANIRFAELSDGVVEAFRVNEQIAASHQIAI